MGRKFDVEWDDFSGGYWLGTNQLTQPRNTWQGDNVIVSYQDGALMAGAALTDVEAVSTWRFGASRYPDPAAGTVDSVWWEDSGSAIVLKVNGTTITSLTGATQNGLHAKRIAAYAGNRAVFGAFTQSGTPKVTVVNYNTNTFSTHNVPVEFGQLQTWGDFVVGAYLNRIHYCAPGDPTSWNANDYYDVGDATISCFAETTSGLLIGTPTGWWMGTGVLGSTFTLRRLNTTSAPVFPASVVDSSLGVLFRASSGGLWTLRGTQAEPVAFDTTTGFGFVRNAGPDFAAMSCPGGAFIYSEATRQWRKITATANWLEPYDGFTAESVLYFVDSTDEDTLAGSARLRSYTHSPTVIQTSGSSFRTVSATLAEFESRVPFKVDEVLVEVDCGISSNNYRRQVGLQIVDPVRPIEYGIVPTTQDEPANMTQTLPAMSSTAGEKFMVRFGMADLGDVFGFAPKVTFEGVKVRRVIARCEERA